MRVAIVVSTPGNMARRGEALRSHLPAIIEAVVAVRPSPRRLATLSRAADLLYVIDAGRNGFAAGVCARVLRTPVVFEVGDPQAPLFRVQGRSRLAVTAGAAIDRLVARRADGVVVRGRRLAELIGVRVPWIELPDGVDAEMFRPGGGDETRRALGIPDDTLVAGLVGNVGPRRRPGLGYGWDLVEAFRHLRREQVVGLVVGGGSGLDALRAYVREAGLDGQVFFAGPVPHDAVPRHVCALDVCISTQTDDPVGQSRTTAKLPEYLACDRFVLATDVGAAADVLPERMRVPYDGSWDAGYPERLATRIAALVAERAEIRRGAGTRTIALERYAYPVLGERLGAFLAEVAG